MQRAGLDSIAPKENPMVTLAVGDPFPPASLNDIDGDLVKFPEVFGSAPVSVVFFYRGRW
jgi:hypothetical protein